MMSHNIKQGKHIWKMSNADCTHGSKVLNSYGKVIILINIYCFVCVYLHHKHVN